MKNYSRTVLAFGSLKEVALYSEYVIPVNLGREILPRKDGTHGLPARIHDLFPPDFDAQPAFIEGLINVNNATFYVLLKAAIRQFGFPPRIGGCPDSKYAMIEEDATEAFYGFVRKFDLTRVPVDCPIELTGGDTSGESDLAVILPAIKMIDTSKLSWDQILAFRQDTKARKLLRRLRLFAFDNYAGKSKHYVEDDILRRIEDYEQQIKIWGCETICSALHNLVTSKMLMSALGGSFLSILFKSPVAAATAATAGVTLELGKIVLEVTKKRFELRHMITENPVSYIGYAKQKLEANA